MSKFKKTLKIEKGRNMHFWCNHTFARGGAFKAEHYWLGIKGLIGFRYSVTW